MYLLLVKDVFIGEHEVRKKTTEKMWSSWNGGRASRELTERIVSMVTFSLVEAVAFDSTWLLLRRQTFTVDRRLATQLLGSLLLRRPGASTQGGNGARCTMAKIGGGKCCDDNDAFARVYNNLLLHEYIYYFTLVHFSLAICPFFYTVSQKTSPMFLAITRESIFVFS